MPPTDFRWHVGNRQAPGTSDTSRFATDHINNPNAINSVFNLAFRPTTTETMADGTTREVHHILKDGADSIGVAGASLRVYANIGMCSDYWLTLHDPVMGRKPQQPFVIDTARQTCEDWRNTEARMENAEAFLKTIGPMRLKDAPGGASFLSGGRRDAAARQDGVRRQVRALPLEQAAAVGADRDLAARKVEAFDREAVVASGVPREELPLGRPALLLCCRARDERGARGMADECADRRTGLERSSRPRAYKQLPAVGARSPGLTCTAAQAGRSDSTGQT